jgi:hypothetical protein
MAPILRDDRDGASPVAVPKAADFDFFGYCENRL